MAHRVTLIPGDGIGPEVTAAARRVLEATGVGFDWDVHELGAAAIERHGTPLPDPAIESIRERGVALKGPVSTPIASGFRSVNIALRDALDLYAGIRPCRSFAGIPTPFPEVEVVIVRMTGEDLYAGIEYEVGTDAAARLRSFVRETTGADVSDDAGVTLKPISRSGAARVARRALAYAREHSRRKVTVVHKATVMRFTDGLFLDAAREVAASEYPDVALEDGLVDAICQRLVRRPEACDVLLAPMLYGDILSDLGAALVGGLGMAPGVNVGDNYAVFEAAHGSVPGQAGRNRANPMALVLSGAMLLRHLGEHRAAARVHDAVAAVVREGRTLTYDLRPFPDDPGAAGTSEVADAVIEALSR